ncbi:MAG: hypothetical protein HYX92_06365 [Chloroflexi bacterium]|nr:hypothetical protein [Chloroflexota bacterium]
MRVAETTDSTPVHVDPGAEPLVKSAVGRLVPKILRVIFDDRKKGLPVKSVELTAFVDPEGEGPAELVFTVRTELPSAQAMKAWDQLSNRIRGELRGRLAARDARLLDRRVSIDVDWV